MKILLAVDGSKHARWAEMLLAQAGGKGHEVEVFYVTPVVRPGGENPSLTEALRECGEKMVNEVARSLANRFATSARVVESHDVAGTVLDRAREIRAELVVGRRGASRLDRFFMGSVSQKITSYAPCSVLVVQ